MEFYKEILQQLGGKKFIVMTGAKALVYDNKTRSLTFKIMKNAKKVTHVKITLNAMDTYDLIFFNCGKEIKIMSQVKGVYFDMLQAVFTDNTGLYTKLF